MCARGQSLHVQWISPASPTSRDVTVKTIVQMARTKHAVRASAAPHSLGVMTPPVLTSLCAVTTTLTAQTSQMRWTVQWSAVRLSSLVTMAHALTNTGAVMAFLTVRTRQMRLDALDIPQRHLQPTQPPAPFQPLSQKTPASSFATQKHSSPALTREFVSA